MAEVVLDRGDEGRHVLEGAPANPDSGNLAEPAFHEVEPRAAGRNEMKMYATMPPQPPLNGWTFVRAQVVQDDVDRLVGGCSAIDPD